MAADDNGRGGANHPGGKKTLLRKILARFVPLGVERGAINIYNFPTDGAFPTSHLDIDGWSAQWVDSAEQAAVATAEHSEQKEKPYGYLLLEAADLLAIVDFAGRPALQIVAAPLQGNDEHVLIKTARVYGKGELKAIRKQLLQICGKVQFI